MHPEPVRDAFGPVGEVGRRLTRDQPDGDPVHRATGTTAAAGPPVFAAPSIGLRPSIEQAFTREHVVIDFAGFSGETLHGAIQEPLDRIRLG
jgi:hypothetical protein